MSLLGFFRKRQKMIFWIMVLLMISFLVGFQGISMLFEGDPTGETIATTRFGEITLRDQARAENDLAVMGQIMPGLDPFGLEAMVYTSLVGRMASDNDGALGYTLLLEDARHAGIDVSEAQIDQKIETLRDGFASKEVDFTSYVTRLAKERGVTMNDIRATLGRFMILGKQFQANASIVPPSDDQLRRVYRDLNEKMKLKVLRYSAYDFLGRVDGPTQEQMLAHFEIYKNRQAGEFSGVEEFPFGYLVPAKVKLSYLVVDRKAVERGTAPGEEEIAEYLRQHGENMTKTFPAPSADTEDPDAEQATKQVPMTQMEKRREAKKQLQGQLAEQKFQNLLDRVQRDVNKILLAADDEQQVNDTTVNAYAQVAASYLRPADDLLARKVPLLVIQDQAGGPTTLEQAVTILAEAAQPSLQAIVFPFGRHEAVNIDPEVKVQLVAHNLTVGEALAKLTEQIPDLPPLDWSAVENFNGVLFPSGGVEFLPLRAETTELLSRDELDASDLLGEAYVMIGDQRRPQMYPLSMLAFNVTAFNADSDFAVGEPGPAMRLGGYYRPKMGEVLWRVVATEQAHAPESLDAVREAVVKDWKLAQAFQLASQEAASVDSLESWTQHAASVSAEGEPTAPKPTILETELLARRTQRRQRGGLTPTMVAAMNFTDPAVDAYFLDETFSILQPDLDGDYGPQSDSIAHLNLPSELAATVSRRVDYRPALQSGFTLQKPSLLMMAAQNEYSTVMEEWFDIQNIKTRTGFAYKK